MARGLSAEQRADRKLAKEQAKNQALAANALAKLPDDKERRDELWRELEALKADGQSAAGQISQHKKRMQDVFGITKEAMQIRAILAKCKDGVYEATFEQTLLFLQDMGRPFQLSMKLEPGKGVAEDTGSVFDRTAAGERHDAERGDDPGRARPRRRSEPAAEPAPSPAMPLDEALAGFQEAYEDSPLKTDDGGDPVPLTARECAAEAAKAGDEHIRKLLNRKGADGLGEHPDEDLKMPGFLKREPPHREEDAEGSYRIKH